jgi:outer membrane protein assembly factor BamB
MNRSFFRVAVCLTLALSLAGCDTFDFVSDWFSSSSKSKLKGERISVMLSDDALKPDYTLRSVAVVLPPPYRNGEWPQPGGFAANAMYHLEAGGALKQVWEQDSGKGSDSDSRLTAPPIVADGRVFVLDAQSHLYVFEASNGKPLWDKDLSPKGPDTGFDWTGLIGDATFGLIGSNHGIDPSKGFGGGAAFEDGRVFVTTGFGSVYALDATSGKLLWKTDLDVPIIDAPTANGGRVFVCTQDNHFYALAEIDGRRLWDHQGISESAGVLESTSPAVAGDFVVAPYSSGELFAIRVENGRPAWNDMLTRSGNVTALSELDDIAGRPVIDRDMVFAISHSGIMAAINLNTGDRVWSRDIGGIQTPWVAGDFLYVTTTEGLLLCLERKDGKVKWIHQLQRWQNMEDKEDPIVWSGPVLVSDRLILVSSDGFAISISPYTGQLLGRMTIPDGTYIPPVVANGTLYLLTNSAQLVALR